MEIQLMLLIGAVVLIALFLFGRYNKASEQVRGSNIPFSDLGPPKLVHSDAVIRNIPTRAFFSTRKEAPTLYDPGLYVNDDGLATFTISFGQEQDEKSQNSEPGRWVRPGESVDVSGHTITGGNFYLGGQLPGQYGMTDASMIDDSYPITPKSMEFSDESMGYGPRFSSISPECRGAYLNWLASDRRTPTIPLGYVFIYFYGLERRILIDAQSPEGIGALEYLAIAQEVRRLLDCYGDSRSFRNYAISFLEAMAILKPDLMPPPVDAYDPIRFPGTSKLSIAKTVCAGKPVPADQALSWLFLSGFAPKTAARRCAPEFAELFQIRYVAKFGEGMAVKPNKTKLKLGYQTANPALGSINLDTRGLTDPTILSGPAKKLNSVAVVCQQDLDAYSRYLGKKGASREDMAGLLLLPDDLLATRSPAALANFRAWADEAIACSGGLMNFADLWSCLNEPIPTKVGKKEADMVQNLAEKAGYGMAPDTRYHHAQPSPDGLVVLFAGGHGEPFEPSSTYKEVAMTLRLGALIAKADGQIDDSEASILRHLIDKNISLSPTDKVSLHAYLLWRLHAPDGMAGMKARLSTLGKPEKMAISRVMVNVALADGTIHPGEIKQIEKLYTALGLDKSLVSGDIHSVSTSGPTAAVIPRADTAKDHCELAFTLDESTLARHESETKDVQRLLGEIFVDSDDTDEEPAPELTKGMESAGGGLDTPHQILFESLVKQDTWSKDVVEDLCKPLGLMVDGALETVNDWAYDAVDAPVFEENGDTIYVDLGVVEEIRESQL
jgi:uncharacterized tellurite resistance protein B-like protein